MAEIRIKMIIAILLFSSIEASMIKFESFPKELQANLTEGVTMRCGINDNSATFKSTSTEVDVRHVTSIFISRDGDKVDVASVTSYDAPMALIDVGNLNAKGSLSAVSGEGYLELSWRVASLMPLGQYTCTVAAIDTRGRMVQLTTDIQMTVVQPSIMDVIASFNLKLLSQQHIIDHQTTLINNQQQQIDNSAQTTNENHRIMNNTYQQCHQEIHNLSKEVIAMRLTEQENHLKIDKLQQKYKTCNSNHVAFTAVLPSGFNSDHKFHLSPNVPVKFDKVVLNEEGHYDASTGQFTCQRPGVYFFSVHGSTNKSYLCLQLMLNSASITNLEVHDPDNIGSASTSATVKLQAGDIVHVHDYCGSMIYLNIRGIEYGKLNTFTGFMVHSDDCLT